MNKKLNPERITKIEEFIKTLSKQELIALNKLVVERVKLIQQLEATNQMSHFNLGDWVKFNDQRGNILKGRIIKMNKKTVSIITDDNFQWNVHPSLLQEV